MSKPFGSKAEYERERADDLWRAYRQHIATVRRVTPAAFDTVVNMPASRFWVSERNAATVMGRMLSGDKLEKMRPTKREMFREIFRRFKIMREYYPGETILRLTTRVCRQSAPKFYLRPETARDIIQKNRLRWHREKFKKFLR